MYSAGFDAGTVRGPARNIVLAFGLMFGRQIPPQHADALRRAALPVGLALLVAGAAARRDAKGRDALAQVGVMIQPSEIMKIAMPLMLAWYFQRREGQLRALDFLIARRCVAGAGGPYRQAA